MLMFVFSDLLRSNDISHCFVFYKQIILQKIRNKRPQKKQHFPAGSFQ